MYQLLLCCMITFRELIKASTNPFDEPLLAESRNFIFIYPISGKI